MNTQYDKVNDAKYIQIRKGKVTETKKEFDWLLFDFSSNGEIIGVEILDASKHPISIGTIGDQLIELSVVVSREAVGDIANSDVNGGEETGKIFAATPQFIEA